GSWPAGTPCVIDVVGRGAGICTLGGGLCVRRVNYYSAPGRGGCSLLVAQVGIEPTHPAVSERCRNHLATGLGGRIKAPPEPVFIIQMLNILETPLRIEPRYPALQAGA